MNKFNEYLDLKSDSQGVEHPPTLSKDVIILNGGEAYRKNIRNSH